MCGFIDDEESTVLAGEFAQGRMKPGGWWHDADVGHGGFGEHAGYIAMGEFMVESVNVVELDDTRGEGGIYGWANVAATGTDDASVERGKRFIHRTVIAPVED